MTNSKIVEQARTWIGTPFHHQARIKHVGCDCLGFVIGLAKELELKDKFGNLFSSYDEKEYPMIPDASDFIKKLDSGLEIIETEKAKPGDLALFILSGNPQHFAILSDIGMIHSNNKSNKVVEHRLDSFWYSQLFKVYRW